MESRSVFPARAVWGLPASREILSPHRQRGLVSLDVVVTMQPRLQQGHSEPEASLQQSGAQVRGHAVPGPVPGIPGVQHPALPR